MSSRNLFYTPRDLEHLVDKTKTQDHMDLGNFATYHRQFLSISDYLLEDNWLSISTRDYLFLQGFPQPIRSEIRRRLSGTKRNLLSREVYSLEDVYDAAQLVLSGCDLDFPATSGTPQDSLSSLIEQVSNLTQLIAASHVPPQHSSSTPGGVFQKPPQWRRACAFCSSQEHLIRDCPTVTLYLDQGWMVYNSLGRFSLPDGHPIPQSFPGANLQERVDSYWNSWQHPEEEPDNRDISPADFSGDSGDYSTSPDVSFTNKDSSDRDEYTNFLQLIHAELNLSYEPGNSISSSLFPRDSPALPQPSLHHDQEDSIGDVEETEDPVESYLSDFFESEDVSPEDLPAGIYVSPPPSLEVSSSSSSLLHLSSAFSLAPSSSSQLMSSASQFLSSASLSSLPHSPSSYSPCSTSILSSSLHDFFPFSSSLCDSPSQLHGSPSQLHGSFSQPHESSSQPHESSSQPHESSSQPHGSSSQLHDSPSSSVFDLSSLFSSSNTPSSSVSSLQSSISLADLLKTRSPPCQTSQHMVSPVLSSSLDTLSTLLADCRDIEDMENSVPGTSPEDSLEILPKPPEFLSGYLGSYSSSEETRRLFRCFWDLLPRVGSFPMDDFLVPQIILELPPSHPPNLPIFLDISLSLATLSRNSGTFANLGEPPDLFHQEPQLMSPDVAIFEDLSLYPHRLYPNQKHQDDPVAIRSPKESHPCLGTTRDGCSLKSQGDVVPPVLGMWDSEVCRPQSSFLLFAFPPLRNLRNLLRNLLRNILLFRTSSPSPKLPLLRRSFLSFAGASSSPEDFPLCLVPLYDDFPLS
ncbi:hypothetical protein BJ322DRAFT_1110287 [Thelephora terrestris]|uniref:CCHC-type domain-containing protein n=1 Tax=Thelephora terrestris TaxID=56493 RepID=A0A9P6HEA0_9AGAM|nr:hypothetical protein BJ322DRAFT_1110287 [Thelephora terrestris]